MGGKDGAKPTGKGQDVETGPVADSRHGGGGSRLVKGLSAFVRDVRTDRAWRTGLTLTLPLWIMYALPSTAPALRTLPTFLFVIAAYNYIPSIGGALSFSLFWAWHGLMTLPFLSALAYATAAGGKGALFGSLVALGIGLQPVLGTSVAVVFLLHSSGFVLSTLDAALAAPDATAFVVGMWGPQGKLTLIAISCALLVPFTVLPYAIGPLLLSSRHSFRSAMDVLDEVAIAHRRCAAFVRISLGSTLPTDERDESTDEQVGAASAHLSLLRRYVVC